MTEDRDKKNQNTKMFPIILGIAAVIFIYILGYRNKCATVSSLGSLTFTMWLFLALTAFFYELNRSELWEKITKSVPKDNSPRPKRFAGFSGFIKKIFNKRESNEDNTLECEKINEEVEKEEITIARPDDLIEIKKETNAEPRPAGAGPEKRVYAVLYILSFLGIAFWRVIRIFKVLPLSYVERYHYSIVDAVLLLLFPCAAVLYLKMRKDDDSCPTDKMSRDILTLFSYVSFIYAAVIAAASVLKINILIILQWTYYTVSVYLVAALALNIVLSIFKDDILGFNYTLFPNIARTRNSKIESADSPAVKWNISFKSLYTIRYTFTILPGLVLVLLFILFLSTGLFVVQPHQQAAVYHFGKLKPSSIKNAGLHFKFPWPIDKAVVYDVHRTASMQIGYESSGTADFLWTKMHDGGEYTLLLGNGNEMAAVNLKIVYVISDLYSYVKNCANPELVLAAAAYNALMSRTINTTLDSFLNVDRNSLSVSVLDELSEFCKSEGLGFSVVQIIVENIHPPIDVADVYQNVVSASVDKSTIIINAQIYAGKKIIDAALQSKIAVDSARAMQYSRLSDAQKEAVVFSAAALAYRTSPVSFELAKYLDTYEKIINGNKVYVFSSNMKDNISKFIIGKVNTINLSELNTGGGSE
jgi:regulator of protease activity HflC (stomatin/prohibitin superfamily)